MVFYQFFQWPAGCSCINFVYIDKTNRKPGNGNSCKSIRSASCNNCIDDNKIKSANHMLYYGILDFTWACMLRNYMTKYFTNHDFRFFFIFLEYILGPNNLIENSNKTFWIECWFENCKKLQYQIHLKWTVLSY
jgi:hypothetical protein